MREAKALLAIDCKLQHELSSLASDAAGITNWLHDKYTQAGHALLSRLAVVYKEIPVVLYQVFSRIVCIDTPNCQFPIELQQD